MLSDCKHLFLVVKHLGETIQSNIWDQLKKKDGIFNFIDLIRLGIGCYFMSMTGPVFNSCSLYVDHKSACFAIQYIAFVAFLELIFLGFAILLIAGVCCYLYMRPTNSTTNSVMGSATSFLERYNPIPLPALDTKCIICMETVDESGDQEWTELDCKHKFHQSCLLEWYRYNPSCPSCRSAINTSEP